jgi:hypothetical protein
MQPTQKDIAKKVCLAKKQLLSLLHLQESDLCFEKILTLDHAYVIYNEWRKHNLPRLLTSLADKDIHSIGRFGEWKYSSMQEAILDGQLMAQKISTRLSVSRQAITEHSKGNVV